MYASLLPGFVASGGLVLPGGTFEIINAGTAGVDSDATEVSQLWTTVAGTTLLVVCVHLGPATTGNDFSDMAFNGAALTEIGLVANVNSGSPGQQWWYRKNPAIGSNLQITYTKSGAGWISTTYHAVQCFNIRGEHATPIGRVDTPDATNTAVATRSDSITTLYADSILLSGGAWQGADMDPVTALEGLQRLAFGTTGGGSTTTDGAFAIGWKPLTTIGAYPYGWQGAGEDGAGVSAVEIRRA